MLNVVNFDNASDQVRIVSASLALVSFCAIVNKLTRCMSNQQENYNLKHTFYDNVSPEATAMFL